MQARENALKEWLTNTINLKEFTLKPLTGDASFRRYYRLYSQDISRIVMDAPPDKEDVKPFIRIAQTLRQGGIEAPEVHAVHADQGFLLLSDFGDDLLLDSLQGPMAESYYHQAITVLFKIQHCSLESLPPFDEAFMLKEMSLCSEWFFKHYLSLDLNQNEHELIHHTMEWIAAEISKQPKTFIHRDYHSRNLMLFQKEDEPVLGVIDFQDAMSGPLTYDLVSLLKDCYISWPRERVLAWVQFFYSQSQAAAVYSLEDFVRAFDLCGLQRHLKVLGVFSRLHFRDQKSGYLPHLPLTLKYVLECTETYKELNPFFIFLQNRVFLP